VFIKKLRNVLLVWLGLLLLLALFSTLTHRQRDYNRVESAIVDGVLPAFSFFNTLKESVLSVWNHYIYLINAQSDNEQLKKQVAQLRSENSRLQEQIQTEMRLRKVLQIKTQLAGPVKVAEVVGRGPSPFLQSLFIDKGRKDGLIRGMPVLQTDGLVGRLEKTSSHHAQVLLLNDPGFAVDCLSQRSRVRGVWTGHPDGFCQIKYVSRNDDIQTGDTIITSGLDELFPKGIILGRVKRVVSQVKGNFLFVEVSPQVNLGQIEEVLIIQRKPRFDSSSDDSPGD
jgi:rod shape-determining protein MreC